MDDEGSAPTVVVDNDAQVQVDLHGIDSDAILNWLKSHGSLAVGNSLDNVVVATFDIDNDDDAPHADENDGAVEGDAPHDDAGDWDAVVAVAADDPHENDGVAEGDAPPGYAGDNPDSHVGDVVAAAVDDKNGLLC
jgi:hypothetical protein